MKIYYLAPFLVAATIPVSAQYYTVFNTEPGPVQKTYATSINDSGDVTGYYLDGYNIGHGFVRDAQGNITLFDASSVAFVSTLPKSINASAVIAGNTATQPDGTSPLDGFVRDAQGNITIFDPAGSTSTNVAGINASGAIAGFFGGQGFIRDAQGNITPFQIPSADPNGGFVNEVAGINDSGAIAGSAVDLFDSGIPFGFIRDPQGNLTRFAVNPAAAQTESTGINASAAITGYYIDAAEVRHGFIRDADGNITTFDPAGSKATSPSSINASGAIAGWYTGAGNAQHGFVRDPQGNITSFDPYAYFPGTSLGTATNAINESGSVAGFFSDEAGQFQGFAGKVPNTIDITESPGPLSDIDWRNARQAGASNVIVQAWGGSPNSTRAQAQLLKAQRSGLATAASIVLNYLDQNSAAYQVGQGIASIGTALSKLKFIVLDIENCCGEFINWRPSASYGPSNNEITDPAGHIQEVVDFGTSGPVAPAWNDSGGTTHDGTVLWQDTGKVVIGQAARVARISAAVSALQAYNLPHGVVIHTNGQKGGWQAITGGCGTGATKNCSSLIALPLWDSELKTFDDLDGKLHCGDGIAGLYGFTPYSSTTWQTRSGNQFDIGLATASSGAAPSCNVPSDGLALHLDYFDPALFQ